MRVETLDGGVGGLLSSPVFSTPSLGFRLGLVAEGFELEAVELLRALVVVVDGFDS